MCPLTGRARPSHTARASSRPCPGAAAGLPELLTSAPPINFALSSRHDAAAEGCEAPSPAVSGWRQRGGDPHRPSRSGTAIADPARPSARPLGAPGRTALAGPLSPHLPAPVRLPRPAGSARSCSQKKTSIAQHCRVLHGGNLPYEETRNSTKWPGFRGTDRYN